MATYVFSDIHGHAAPLRRLLGRIAPADGDRFFCLGDMIDRGPDPLGVVDAVRSLPNACVLMGNHEDLMLQWVEHPSNMTRFDWEINGGGVTDEALGALEEHARIDLLDWFGSLATGAVCAVGERLYVLVHAGILPYRGPHRIWDADSLSAHLLAADPQDLMWVRHEFWENPTGLVDAAGEGPIVIAGHTPTRYLDQMCVQTDRPCVDDAGICQSVRVGEPAACGGVWDKWNIDSGCAGGAGFDDGAEFVEAIAEGE